jgi:ABC-type Fe3+-hydroxamate transport system substrate-binding protein
MVDAAKDGKVYIVNTDIISHAGPRAFDVLDWMAAILREPAS